MTFIVYGYHDIRSRENCIERIEPVKAKVQASLNSGHTCYHGIKSGELLQVVEYDGDFALVRTSEVPNSPSSAEFPLWIGCKDKEELATLLRRLADKLVK